MSREDSAPIKAGFLNRQDAWREVTLLDAAILLFHVQRAAQDPNIGFEDAERTLEQLTRKMNKTVWLEKSALESALWSANLSSEQGKFWHPAAEPFDSWVKRMFPKDSFHKIFNTLERKRPL